MTSPKGDLQGLFGADGRGVGLISGLTRALVRGLVGGLVRAHARAGGGAGGRGGRLAVGPGGGRQRTIRDTARGTTGTTGTLGTTGGSVGTHTLGTPGSRRLLRFRSSPRTVSRQAMIGAAVISIASVAQVTIAGWLCPSTNEATSEPPKTSRKNRCTRNVPKSVSGLDESPFGVTTNLLLRRSTVSNSDRA